MREDPPEPAALLWLVQRLPAARGSPQIEEWRAADDVCPHARGSHTSLHMTGWSTRMRGSTPFPRWLIFLDEVYRMRGSPSSKSCLPFALVYPHARIRENVTGLPHARGSLRLGYGICCYRLPRVGSTLEGYDESAACAGSPISAPCRNVAPSARMRGITHSWAAKPSRNSTPHAGIHHEW